MTRQPREKINRDKAWKRILPVPKSVDLSANQIQVGEDWRIAGEGANGEQQEKWCNAFGLSTEKRDRAITLEPGPMNDEAYEIDISDSAVTVRASGDVGFGYALQTMWQLSPNGFFRTGHIKDHPALKMRGFHVDFWSLYQMGTNKTDEVGAAELILRYASELKINTLLFEYGQRFPYPANPDIAVPRTLARDEVDDLMEKARRYRLEVIPLQQCLGHLDHVLKHDAYADLREEHEYRDQLCPLNPSAFDLFKSLSEQMIEAHPGIRYFHMGGDEARRLGTCPMCRRKVEKEGVSRLYVDYVNKAAAWVKEQGLIPIIWDDMLCKHWQDMDDLDRDIIIMYWDYWTTGNRSPYFLARPFERGNIYDQRWDSEWRSELSDLEHDVIMNFARSADLEEIVSASGAEHFKKYFGEEFPKRIKGLPYYEYYRDLGFKVIGAPTTLGNGDNFHTLPNYWRFVPNIRTHCERSIESGAEGVITTAWYNYAPLVFHFGLAATAQFAWGLPASF